MSEVTNPTCPRCGYDQSGTAGSWTDACPLKGVCAECGEGFAWSDVLNPHPTTLHWYAEHSPTRRALLWRTIRTLVMLIDPGQFWSRVRGDIDRSTIKLVWFVSLAFVFAHLAVSVFGYIAAQTGQQTFHAVTRPVGTISDLGKTLVNANLFPYWELVGPWSAPTLLYDPGNIFIYPVIGVLLGWTTLVWVCVVLIIRRVDPAHSRTPGALRRALIINPIALVVSAEYFRAYDIAGNAYTGLQFNIWFEMLAVLTLVAIVVWNLIYWSNFAARVCRNSYTLQAVLFGNALAIGPPVLLLLMLIF